MKQTPANFDLENKRPTFLLFGLAVTLLAVYGLFNLKSYREVVVPKDGGTQNIDNTYSIPPTFRTPPQLEKQKLDVKKANKKVLSQTIFIEVPNTMLLANLVNEEPLDVIDGTIGREELVMTIDINSLDKKPIFPGCENILDEEERFACFKEKMAAFVAKNLKPCDGAFGPTTERMYVMFTIDEFGRAVNTEVAHVQDACNGEKAIEVIGKLPRMIPGKYMDKQVKTKFVIPVNIK